MTGNPNLQAVRDLIAAAPDDATNMAVIGAPSCGTPGCIIGWTVGVSDPDDFRALFDATYRAKQILGLHAEQYDNLTLCNQGRHQISTLEITKDEVLTAIDSILEDPDRIMPAWPQRVVDMLEDE